MKIVEKNFVEVPDDINKVIEIINNYYVREFNEDENDYLKKTIKTPEDIIKFFNYTDMPNISEIFSGYWGAVESERYIEK